VIARLRARRDAHDLGQIVRRLAQPDLRVEQRRFLLREERARDGERAGADDARARTQILLARNNAARWRSNRSAARSRSAANSAQYPFST
jgi:hypothetical protein